jgi:hypothetical protein
MKPSDIVASIGVIILLIAFLLNLYKKLPTTNKVYGLLNFVGAAICACAAWMVKFYPFIVLESVWSLVALVSLVKVPRGTSINTN